MNSVAELHGRYGRTSLTARRQRAGAALRSACRPGVEALEGRRLLTVFAVTNTNDSDSGSLRQAILDANANPGSDTIQFQIPGTGVHTIVPGSALPPITDPVVFDVTQEPGYAGKPLIELDGAVAGTTGVNGLVISAGNSTVSGLIINRFSGEGLVLNTAGGDVVKGNYVGTDPSGEAAPGNADGVAVQSVANVTIGGTGAADR